MQCSSIPQHKRATFTSPGRQCSCCTGHRPTKRVLENCQGDEIVDRQGWTLAWRAVLRVAPRGGQANILHRPLQLLYPLKIHDSSGKDDHTPSKEDLQNLTTHEDKHTSSAEDTSTHHCEQDKLTSPSSVLLKNVM